MRARVRASMRPMAREGARGGYASWYYEIGSFRRYSASFVRGAFRASKIGSLLKSDSIDSDSSMRAIVARNSRLIGYLIYGIAEIGPSSHRRYILHRD